MNIPFASILIKGAALIFFAPFLGSAFVRINKVLEKALKQKKKKHIWAIMSLVMLMCAVLLGWLTHVTWLNFISLIFITPLCGYFAMLGAVGLKNAREEKK